MPLAAHFLGSMRGGIARIWPGFDETATQRLLAHPWQGNVRELNHVIERAVLMAQGRQIRQADLALRPADARTRRGWKR